MRKRVSLLLALAMTLLGLAVASPAQAGRSACASGYVCGWADASWMGTMAMYDPGYIQSQPGRCLNFNNSSLQDAISSVASYSSVDVVFWQNINCSGGSWYVGPLAQVKDFKGTGYNDSFSSISVP
jgi:hypothetical protein